MYYPTRDQLLRAAHWDFARRQDYLSQLKSSNDTNSTCPVPWGYEYAYPSGCLKARFILPYLQTANGVSPPLTTASNLAPPASFSIGSPVRFLVATDTNVAGNDSTVILTNQPNALLVYTKQITNPDLFDSQFQEALVAALAAKLVPALQLNMNLMKAQVALAERIINEARVTNGNEGPEVMNLIPDWIRARGVGYGDGYAGYYFQGWDSMAWPSGY